MSRLPLVFTLSTCFLIALPACGDDDSASGPALTLEEFQTQGNAICTQGSSDIGALFADGQDPSTLPDDEKQALFDQIISITQRQIDQISALKAPKDITPAVESLMKGLSETTETLQSGGPSALFAQTEDPFTRYNAQFEELGLTACVSAG